MFGIRADASHYNVDSFLTENSGTASAALISPKGGVTLGPWKSTEFYVNGGTGFHSNNALGTTITHDYLGNDIERVTPLVRGMGGEVGVRSVAIPHLQTTVSLWELSLDSELVYNGDIGATEPGDSSRRWGVEFANYVSPTKWLVFDADVSLSKSRFTSGEVKGLYVPEAVGAVVSAGASVDGYKKTFASLRWRYFGPRALLEDNSVRSDATSLINFQGGYQLFPKMRLSVDVFNLFDTKAADITYWFASRLPGEPLEGVNDFHIHPAVPRTVRAGFIIGF
jgi:outer membrane receptor protein involved in Fe transport